MILLVILKAKDVAQFDFLKSKYNFAYFSFFCLIIY